MVLKGISITGIDTPHRGGGSAKWSEIMRPEVAARAEFMTSLGHPSKKKNASERASARVISKLCHFGCNLNAMTTAPITHVYTACIMTGDKTK